MEFFQRPLSAAQDVGTVGIGLNAKRYRVRHFGHSTQWRMRREIYFL